MQSHTDNGRDTAPAETMAPAIAEDRTWIEATLRGEKDAFAQLVAKYQKPLYAALRRLVRRHDDTDDLLQEAFVRAYQHLKDFDHSRPFYPWLHRIAVNLAITFIQRRKRQSNFSGLNVDEIFPTAPVTDHPDEKAEQSEMLAALEKAIERLPAEQRVVLLLRTREDMSYQELSEHLGIEIGTVMSRLARAREKLRAWLRPYLEISSAELER
ncbi:MAG: sigma-70 family RNA polymerase sigma factor [candidate division KSB1 bacterium]|nr:sigma-70 family RNA polymerase sigma factor [candidate division KSB1 bacterium]MDZ7367529.1 sigma-70 family RNA polymerase sigma factor [candidate division KSB1 bacterium]MDZ7404913.1 sigma-70 family RNA polymerase sigma factor [candidate division KSB1 bacterium]